MACGTPTPKESFDKFKQRSCKCETTGQNQAQKLREMAGQSPDQTMEQVMGSRHSATQTENARNLKIEGVQDLTRAIKKLSEKIEKSGASGLESARQQGAVASSAGTKANVAKIASDMGVTPTDKMMGSGGSLGRAYTYAAKHGITGQENLKNIVGSFVKDSEDAPSILKSQRRLKQALETQRKSGVSIPYNAEESIMEMAAKRGAQQTATVTSRLGAMPSEAMSQMASERGTDLFGSLASGEHRAYTAGVGLEQSRRAVYGQGGRSSRELLGLKESQQRNVMEMHHRAKQAGMTGLQGAIEQRGAAFSDISPHLDDRQFKKFGEKIEELTSNLDVSSESLQDFKGQVDDTAKSVQGGSGLRTAGLSALGMLGQGAVGVTTEELRFSTQSRQRGMPSAMGAITREQENQRNLAGTIGSTGLAAVGAGIGGALATPFGMTGVGAAIGGGIGYQLGGSFAENQIVGEQQRQVATNAESMLALSPQGRNRRSQLDMMGADLEALPALAQQRGMFRTQQGFSQFAGASAAGTPALSQLFNMPNASQAEISQGLMQTRQMAQISGQDMESIMGTASGLRMTPSEVSNIGMRAHTRTDGWGQPNRLTDNLTQYRSLQQENPMLADQWMQFGQQGFTAKTTQRAMSQALTGHSMDDILEGRVSRDEVLSGLEKRGMSPDLLKDISPELFDTLAASKTDEKGKLPEEITEGSVKDLNERLVKSAQEYNENLGGNSEQLKKLTEKMGTAEEFYENLNSNIENLIETFGEMMGVEIEKPEEDKSNDSTAIMAREAIIRAGV